jgi:hypothetical protein
MCCLASILVFLGPRVGLIFWYLYSPGRFDRVFDGWVWPVLGFIFLPWTTLMWVAVGLGGVDGWDWLWVALGFLADLATYSGGGWKNKGQVQTYSSRYAPR